MAHFLVIHGLQNHRPEGHWHRRLVTALRQQGHVVAYPQLPSPDAPVLEDWLEVVDTELKLLSDSGANDVVVIAHSLGCVTWLRYITSHLLPVTISRVLFVAPADPELLAADAPTFVEDFEVSSAREAFAHLNPTILASDNDEWLPRGVAETFGNPLKVAPIVWSGAQHFSLSDGWGEWRGVIEWATDPRADLCVR
ncbi:MAG: hypothetical protein RL410_1246 [Actinomycetota bacterium]